MEYEKPIQTNLAPEQIKRISDEVKEMFKVDQEMRRGWETRLGFSISEEEQSLDKAHSRRLKKIVSEVGWPTISRFGEKVADDSWLLVQHADHDIEFQRHCLELMKTAGEGEVNVQNIAYLEDRVRVNEDKPQLYGTQFYPDPNEKVYVPSPIEDPENVDKRRKEIGLESLAEYAKNWDEINKKILEQNGS